MSQGSLGTYIVLKTALEGVILAWIARVESGMFRIPEMNIESSYDHRIQILTEESINIDSGSFPEIQNLYGVIDCCHGQFHANRNVYSIEFDKNYSKELNYEIFEYKFVYQIIKKDRESKC